MTSRYSYSQTFPRPCWQLNYFKHYLIGLNTSCPRLWTSFGVFVQCKPRKVWKSALIGRENPGLPFPFTKGIITECLKVVCLHQRLRNMVQFAKLPQFSRMENRLSPGEIRFLLWTANTFSPSRVLLRCLVSQAKDSEWKHGRGDPFRSPRLVRVFARFPGLLLKLRANFSGASFVSAEQCVTPWVSGYQGIWDFSSKHFLKLQPCSSPAPLLLLALPKIRCHGENVGDSWGPGGCTSMWHYFRHALRN